MFNGEEFLEQTIQSVINQGYSNFEYIIIDGGSTDNTLNIILKYEKAITIWISEKDKGIYAAMNKGIALSKGEFISFLNSDDYYLPGTFKKVAQEIESNVADIYHGDVQILSRNSPIEFAKPAFGTENISKLGRGEYIYQPATFIRKSIFEKVGVFNEKLKIVSDYEFFLRAESRQCKFYHINEILTVFRSGGISDSSRTLNEAYVLLKYHGTVNDYFKLTFLIIKRNSKKIVKRILKRI